MKQNVEYMFIKRNGTRYGVFFSNRAGFRHWFNRYCKDNSAIWYVRVAVFEENDDFCTVFTFIRKNKKGRWFQPHKHCSRKFNDLVWDFIYKCYPIK